MSNSSDLYLIQSALVVCIVRPMGQAANDSLIRVLIGLIRDHEFLHRGCISRDDCVSLKENSLPDWFSKGLISFSEG